MSIPWSLNSKQRSGLHMSGACMGVSHFCSRLSLLCIPSVQAKSWMSLPSVSLSSVLSTCCVWGQTNLPSAMQLKLPPGEGVVAFACKESGGPFQAPLKSTCSSSSCLPPRLVQLTPCDRGPFGWHVNYFVEYREEASGPFSSFSCLYLLLCQVVHSSFVATVIQNRFLSSPFLMPRQLWCPGRSQTAEEICFSFVVTRTGVSLDLTHDWTVQNWYHLT